MAVAKMLRGVGVVTRGKMWVGCCIYVSLAESYVFRQHPVQPVLLRPFVFWRWEDVQIMAHSARPESQTLFGGWGLPPDFIPYEDATPCYPVQVRTILA